MEHLKNEEFLNKNQTKIAVSLRIRNTWNFFDAEWGKMGLENVILTKRWALKGQRKAVGNVSNML